jgi:hypothetical protein
MTFIDRPVQGNVLPACEDILSSSGNWPCYGFCHDPGAICLQHAQREHTCGFPDADGPNKGAEAGLDRVSDASGGSREGVVSLS